MVDEELYDLEVVPDYLVRSNRRATRRIQNMRKARHKRRLSRRVYGIDWYRNLHQFSKNKIHCSCNLCRFKPTWDPDNKPIQDVKRIQSMDEQLRMEDFIN